VEETTAGLATTKLDPKQQRTAEANGVEQLKVEKEQEKVESDSKEKGKSEQADDTNASESSTADQIDDEMARLAPEFDFRGEDGLRGARFMEWTERFEIFAMATGLDVTGCEDKHRASYLMSLGTEAFQIYKTLRKGPAIKDDTLAEIKKFMTNYFKPRYNEYAHLAPFRAATKGANESVQEYVMRLRVLAAPLNLAAGAVHDKEVEKQFVLTCNMPRLKEKICEYEGGETNPLSLDMIVGWAVLLEQLESNVGKMQQTTGSSIYYARQAAYNGPSRSAQTNAFSKSSSNGSAECQYCGGIAHSSGEECRAKHSECFKCHKIGHLARKCRSTAADNFQDQRSYSPSRGGGSQRNVSFQQKRGDQQRPSGGVHQIGHGQAQSGLAQQTAAQVITTTQDSVTLHGADLDEYLRFKRAAEFGLYTVGESRTTISAVRENDRPRVAVDFCQTKVSMMVDTGSSINAIDERTFNNLTARPELSKCNNSYFGFASNEAMEVIGQFITTVTFRNKSQAAGFIVVKGQHRNLLSYKTAVALRIVVMDSEIHNSKAGLLELRALATQHSENVSECSRQELAVRFPNLFSGKLGCDEGEPVKLDMDPTDPSVLPQQPTALGLQGAGVNELLNQVDESILKRVDEKSGPTPRVIPEFNDEWMSKQRLQKRLWQSNRFKKRKGKRRARLQRTKPFKVKCVKEQRSYTAMGQCFNRARDNSVERLAEYEADRALNPPTRCSARRQSAS
jgi:hypothetical protein